MDYGYHDSKPTHANAYLWPVLKLEISRRRWTSKRAFDLGCGNGATCNMLSELGFATTGTDISTSGIEHARSTFPHVKCDIGSAYDDLASLYGTFGLVVSLEVVEHCLEPRAFSKTFMSSIASGGIGVASIPSHGYL